MDYIDGQEASDKFTKNLETAVKAVKNNEKWRVEHMTLEMHYREWAEQLLEQEKMQTAVRMLQAGELPVEEIALYTGLTVEQVLKLKEQLELASATS